MSTKPVMDASAIERRRHRSWPEALKRKIVAASFAPGASVSVVARQYDVNANQVFSWRKRYRPPFDVSFGVRGSAGNARRDAGENPGRAVGRFGSIAA